MQRLHLHWQPRNVSPAPAQLFVWVEEDETNRPTRSRSRQHPFAQVTPELHTLLQPLSQTPRWPYTVTRTLPLPTGPDGPLPATDRTVIDSPATENWRIPGLGLVGGQCWALLVRLCNDPALPDGMVWGRDALYWLAATDLALRIIDQEEIELTPNKRVTDWSFLEKERYAARLAALEAALPPLCCHNLDDPDQPHQPAALLQSFLRKMIGDMAGAWYQKTYSGLTGFLMEKGYQLALNNIKNGYQTEGYPPHLIQLHRAYNRWHQEHADRNDDEFQFALQLSSPDGPPEQPDATTWTLEFALQSRTDPSLILTADQLWRSNFLGRLLGRLDASQKQLLADLREAAPFFEPLQTTLADKKPATLPLTTTQAFDFLRQAAPLLQAAGVKIFTPQWWSKQPARLTARLKMSAAEGETPPGTLTFDRLVHYRWQMSVGDTRLSQEEFEALVTLKSPLVYVENRWVHLDAQQVEAAARYWEDHPTEAELPLLDGLRFAWGQEDAPDALDVAEVSYDDWLGERIGRLTGDRQLTTLPAPEGLQGQLRHYQAYGFAWLDFMRRAGLGACLADDMGLGKTLQTLVMLLREKEETGRLPGPTLLICPTSVTSNWTHESHRFTPGLTTLLHQGPDRLKDKAFADRAKQVDLVVTSYTLAHLDRHTLHPVNWFGVILDEAQNIKNPAAKRTKAVRSFKAQFRLALTGTPVENRLSELWSIMHFLNPGYLGPLKNFRTEFVTPIERRQDEAATAGLRRLTSPFILRRLKTDPTVIQDLPEKNEMKVYCPLSEEQASLYQAVVNESLGQIDQASGIKRKGMVLSTLLKLKQVCNHPGQYLHQLDDATGNLALEARRSGKMARMGAMLDEASSIGDRSLIFTQFVEMGHFLQRWLTHTLKTPALFLHGGVPAQKRKKLIGQFQDEPDGPPVFILSLKAGGTGLNLTRANHVFHFDRWWNPAVEDQATDRAFRIGQRKDVQVHKFICTGTLEEMIDEMIERKKGLAESVVGGGEGWLTELSTADLRELLTLRPEAGA